jgi:hypothetical protein
MLCFNVKLHYKIGQIMELRWARAHNGIFYMKLEWGRACYKPIGMEL